MSMKRNRGRIVIPKDALTKLLFFVSCLFVFVFDKNTTIRIAGVPLFQVNNALIVILVVWQIASCIRQGGVLHISSGYGSLILFVAMSCISLVYSISFSATFDRVKRLVIVLAYSIAIYQTSRHKTSLHFYLKAFAWSGVAAALFLLISPQYRGSYGLVRLGSAIGDENYVGITMAYAVCVLIYLYKVEKKKICLAGIGIVSGAVFLSGSRTAFVLLLLAVIGNVYFTAYQKKWKAGRVIGVSIVLLLLVIGVLYLVMNIPMLYNSIGVRIESFFDIMNGQKSSFNERSTQNRIRMMNTAMSMFYESPIWGKGINSFLGLYGGFCHCDYTELLSGLGAIGFSLFFGPFVGMMFSMRKVKHESKSMDLAALLMTLVLMFLLGEILLVMHYEKLTWILFALIFSIRDVVLQHEKE